MANAAAAALFPNNIPDPVGCLDAHGKPIFDATFSHRYRVSEKDMTDAQKMAWRTYQLYRLTMKVERRDSVYQAMMSSDYSNFNSVHHWLGTPYPIIEPHPFILEAFSGIRWYEHAISLSVGYVFFQVIRLKPNYKYTTLNPSANRAAMLMLMGMNEFLWAHRSVARLQGKMENHHECMKYGVMETPDRLQKKAENWAKYKAYKDEWTQRWDYYVWGMRPGERYTFFSQCQWAPRGTYYCTKTDYPQRINPFLLSTRPINKWRMETAIGYYYAPGADTSLERTKPEINYLYKGGVG